MKSTVISLAFLSLLRLSAGQPRKLLMQYMIMFDRL